MTSPRLLRSHAQASAAAACGMELGLWASLGRWDAGPLLLSPEGAERQADALWAGHGEVP